MAEREDICPFTFKHALLEQGGCGISDFLFQETSTEYFEQQHFIDNGQLPLENGALSEFINKPFPCGNLSVTRNNQSQLEFDYPNLLSLQRAFERDNDDELTFVRIAKLSDHSQNDSADVDAYISDFPIDKLPQEQLTKINQLQEENER